MKILIDNGHGIQTKGKCSPDGTLLEDNATPADRAAHIDLADWILKYLETDNN
jgi:hypothetical protein